MIKKRNLIAILSMMVLCSGILPGFDALYEFKLKLLNQNRPGKAWNFLNLDRTFALKYEDPDSFIRRATCVEIKGKNIFILDNNSHKLVVYDGKGNFLQKVGVPGRGPGDIEFPIWHCLYNDKIFIANNNGIDIFGKNLKFVDRIRPFFFTLKFLVADDKIYSVPAGSYKGGYPFFLKLDMNGTVEAEFRDKDFENSYLKNGNSGYVVNLNGGLMFVPMNFNTVYFFEKDGRVAKKIKIKYEFLDRLGEWNKRQNEKGKRVGGALITWFANMIASAKTHRGKLYILLKIPRLEIISIDMDGNVQDHFYNDRDFKFMRWYDFSIETIGEQTVFYVLGFSLDPENSKQSSEFGLFRMVPTIDEKSK